MVRHATLALLTAAALVVGASVVSTAAAPHTAAPRPALPAANAVEALLVGDSVMAGMAQSYGLKSRQLLAARHSFILDAKGCRRLITTSCSIGSSPAPSTALQTVDAWSGSYWAALVMAAGYNDSTYGSTGLSTAVDVMLARAATQGVPYVVWLTYREAGPSASKFRAHNALLRSKAATHPNLILADWATRSAGLPSSWFSADGIHLGTDATIAMADLVADTLDTLPGWLPTSPCVLTATTAVATTAPPAPVTAVPTGAGDAALPANRLRLSCPPG